MDEDPDAPEKPVNKTPEVLQDAFSAVVMFLQSYGWYIVIAVIAIYYLKGKFEQKYAKWHSARSREVDLHRYDDAAVLSRQLAMEESRRRMQEKLDADAARYLEEQQKKEEEKRKNKLEDWDRHVEGKGYRSKYRPAEEPAAATARPSTSSASSSQAKKKTYKADNYSPLAGGGGGGSFCSYRPDRRGGASGGG